MNAEGEKDVNAEGEKDVNAEGEKGVKMIYAHVMRRLLQCERLC